MKTWPVWLISTFFIGSSAYSFGDDDYLSDYAVDQPYINLLDEPNIGSQSSNVQDWDALFEKLMSDPQFAKEFEEYRKAELQKNKYETRNSDTQDPYYHCRGHPSSSQLSSQNTEDSQQTFGDIWKDVPLQKRLKRSFCTPSTANQPHDKSCGCYIGCPSGFFQLLRCEEGLLFDSQVRTCRPAWEVRNCARSVAPITPPQTEGPKTLGLQEVRCPSEFGLYPHPTDCRLFLNCDRYKAHIQSCGPGTVFSKKHKVCTHLNQEDCGRAREDAFSDYSSEQDDREGYGQVQVAGNSLSLNSQKLQQSIPPPRPISVDVQNLRCPEEFGYFPHPSDCRLFLNCDRNIVHVRSCRPETVYSRRYKVCVYPNQEECGGVTGGQTGGYYPEPNGQIVSGNFRFPSDADINPVQKPVKSWVPSNFEPQQNVWPGVIPVPTKAPKPAERTAKPVVTTKIYPILAIKPALTRTTASPAENYDYDADVPPGMERRRRRASGGKSHVGKGGQKKTRKTTQPIPVTAV